MKTTCRTLAACLICAAAVGPIFAATCEEVFARAAAVPWAEPDQLFPSEDWARCAATRWGPRWASSGCMHPTDHQAALRVVNGVEPSMLAVEDSWHSGCSIVWQARCVVMKRDSTGRPLDWSQVAPGSRMLEVLAYLQELRTSNCVTSISAAMQIFDGKKPDPEPAKTAATLELWTGEPPTRDPVCPAGESCKPPCPSCTQAGVLSLPRACRPIAAVLESAKVIARNPATAQHRRQKVADCVAAIERAFAGR